MARVVFHRWLHRARKPGFNASHLSYASQAHPQCQAAVKLHGVFLSCRGYTRIFTGTSISPSPSLRQCPDRYAIRAGRNLPDKEFRYLRTVIVTAAVHWGFGSRREPLPLTFRHWAGVSPYTSAFALAETCVFGKQSPGPVHCGPHAPAYVTPGAPLLPKLRGQFAEFLNEGSLVHLGVLTPTHLCRFAVRSRPSLRSGFSCQLRLSPVALTVVAASSPHRRILPSAYGQDAPCPIGTQRPTPPGSPSASSTHGVVLEY